MRQPQSAHKNTNSDCRQTILKTKRITPIFHRWNLHFYQIQKRLYAGISIFIPKEKYTSKLYNILNLVWHNYNTTFFIIYQDTFKKIAKYTNKNRHFCDSSNYFDLSALYFAVLIDEISITRILVHTESRDLYVTSSI